MKWNWQYYSRGRSNSQENPPTIDLPEVSKLIDSAIRKRQGDQRKHSFLENEFTMNTRKYHITWWIVLWNNRLINFTKYFVHISKCLACNTEKTLQLKITKKELFMVRMTRNKYDSINSILQHGLVVDNCCAVFPT